MDSSYVVGDAEHDNITPFIVCSLISSMVMVKDCMLIMSKERGIHLKVVNVLGTLNLLLLYSVIEFYLLITLL